MRKTLKHLAITLTLLTVSLTMVGQNLIVNNINVKGNINLLDIPTAPDTASVLSISGNGRVGRCAYNCDSLQGFSDSINNSPWTYNGTGDVVLRDTTDNVGIGTATPTEKLHVEGTFLAKKQIGDNIYSIYLNEGNEQIEIQTLNVINNKAATIITGGYTGNSVGLSFTVTDGVGGVAAASLLSDNGGFVYQLNLPSKGANKILTSDADGNATWQAPITYRGDTIVSGVATAGSFTIPNTIGGVILSGTGTAITYTLALPSNPTEGQKILITNNGVIITTLSFAGNGNSLSTTLTGGVGMTVSGQRWVTFHNGTWY